MGISSHLVLFSPFLFMGVKSGILSYFILAYFYFLLFHLWVSARFVIHELLESLFVTILPFLQV